MLTEFARPELKNHIEPFEMGFVGDPRVLKTIIHKSQHPEDPSKKTCLLLPGGAQRGIYQVGVGLALHNLGITEGIDFCVGGSSEEVREQLPERI